MPAERSWRLGMTCVPFALGLYLSAFALVSLRHMPADAPEMAQNLTVALLPPLTAVSVLIFASPKPLLVGSYLRATLAFVAVLSAVLAVHA